MKNNKESIRNAIGDEIVKLATNNEKIVVVNADMILTCRLRRFEKEFPNRIFNVGIAEQNMVSFAAGLAHEGFIPFIFTMAPFMSMRACEQIRTDVTYENLNIKIISPYSGCSGGISGPTHWGMEDYGIFSSFPNMRILEPSDANQARKLLTKSLEIKGPVYIRCGANNYSVLYDESANFDIGHYYKINDGDDGMVICSGTIVEKAYEAIKILRNEYNKKIALVDLYSLKPLNDDIFEEIKKQKKVLIIQDHNVNTSVGTTITSKCLKKNIYSDISILGIPDCFYVMAHSNFLEKKFGYDIEGIVKFFI